MYMCRYTYIYVYMYMYTSKYIYVYFFVTSSDFHRWIDGHRFNKDFMMIINTIDQKEKSFTDGSILSVVWIVSIGSIGMDPSSTMPSFAI